MAGRDERLFRDSKLTGFALRVRRAADGTTLMRDWFVLQPVPGKSNPKKIPIGNYPTFNADKAREEGEGMLRAVKRGDDPSAERATKKAQPQWEDLLAAFRAKFLPKKQPSTVKRYNGVINRILTPAFKGRRVADISTPMVAAMYARRARTQADANNAMRVLSKMMSFAIGEGMRPDKVNPCGGIERYKPRARERWLDEKELPLYVAALAKAPVDAVHDLLRFLTITGWRVTDARLLDHAQVNLKTLEVHLEDSATKGRPTALSADAAALIARQPGQTGAVFSNGGGRPVDYKKLRAALAAVLLAAGVESAKPASDGVIENVTPHTLRHTAASWSALGGADPFELRDTFAWKTLAMAGRYVKRADTRARRGVERLAGAINLNGKPSAEIKSIAEAKR
ncbi:tyrosine-type recombinase/integrase [Bradyrhizobium sp. LCT2]|uniref:tyrosine-type recombinase/integrase n=1 Tax=Bradyrhizobium sp. LCT2 TaxID=2493093 RepID=UPI001374A77D|nr:tyrosine-type recombinase/integrase [Bradyrhizobium sp. LCT2]